MANHADKGKWEPDMPFQKAVIKILLDSVPLKEDFKQPFAQCLSVVTIDTDQKKLVKELFKTLTFFISKNTVLDDEQKSVLKRTIKQLEDWDTKQESGNGEEPVKAPANRVPGSGQENLSAASTHIAHVVGEIQSFSKESGADDNLKELHKEFADTRKDFPDEDADNSVEIIIKPKEGSARLPHERVKRNPNGSKPPSHHYSHPENINRWNDEHANIDMPDNLPESAFKAAIENQTMDRNTDHQQDIDRGDTSCAKPQQSTYFAPQKEQTAYTPPAPTAKQASNDLGPQEPKQPDTPRPKVSTWQQFAADPQSGDLAVKKIYESHSIANRERLWCAGDKYRQSQPRQKPERHRKRGGFLTAAEIRNYERDEYGNKIERAPTPEKPMPIAPQGWYYDKDGVLKPDLRPKKSSFL
ncbi:hypothetical protein GGS21DRAFT_542852 [Xylaria nigripes]|nr:hypothetical protein GGS21DRAFT_542852 [Xylaria nigripes]